MYEYSPEEITKKISERDKNQMLDLTESIIHDVDFSGQDLTNIDFSFTRFERVDLTEADMSHSKVSQCSFYDCKMQRIKFTGSDLRESIFRYNDLSGSDISGADLHHAVLEEAVLDDIKSDENTKWWRMVPPEKGPFIAWKCCTELRVVQMLVPADAQRVSATAETCRCSKAKVLSIKSIDETKSYDWAQSTVDPDFYYEVGKWAVPSNGFEPDRWKDSSRGIHFFMERQQAVDYQAK
jgi:hypothetical protein